MDNLFEKNGATFSANRRHRYALWRIWDENKPLIMFIGLNPSTADEDDNDKTIRRVIGFAKDWGYGGMYMMNLFTYITPYPKELTNLYDPYMDDYILLLKISEKCKSILFCWGTFKQAKKRADIVSRLFKNALCLGKNKDGSPKHPLYMLKNTKPIKFTI